MMRHTLLLLLLVAGAESTRVLFVGNSYTYYNDLPNMFRQLADSLGMSVTVDSDTAGGRRIGQAAATASVKAKLDAGNFDVLVLQEQSQIGGVPAVIPERVASEAAVADVFAPAAIKAGAIMLFYQTWGRRKDEPQWGWASHLQMQHSLEAGYAVYADIAAREKCATVRTAYAGETFKKAYEFSAATSPGGAPSDDTASLFYKLYSGDGSHPSVSGSYAVAWSLILAINVNARWTPTTFTSGMDVGDAERIARFAAQVVEEHAAIPAEIQELQGRYHIDPTFQWVIHGTKLSHWGRNVDTETYDLTVKQGKVYSSDTKYVTDVTPNAAQITWSDGDIYSNPSATCNLPAPSTVSPTSAPLTIAPATPAPATSAPATPAPATPAPLTIAPDTQAPATSAPDTSAPATPAPLTTAPATPAPATPAPDTAAPPPAGPLRVLFIGNSYTAANNLPDMFRKLADSLGMSVTVDSDTAGGRMLGQAAATASVKAKLDAGNFDVLVLQDQSNMGGVPASMRDDRTVSEAAVADVYTPAAVKAGATVVFYQTWGRRNKDEWWGWTSYLSMQHSLETGYAVYADIVSREKCATVRTAYAGETFKKTYEFSAATSPGGAPSDDPNSLFHKLYSGDGSHPSVSGTYAVAWSVVLAINANKRWTPTTFTSGMDVGDAERIAGFAAQVVEEHAAIPAEIQELHGRYHIDTTMQWVIHGTTLSHWGAYLDDEKYDLTVKQGKVYSSDTKYVTDVTPNAAQITWSDGDIYSNPSATCNLPAATPAPAKPEETTAPATVAPATPAPHTPAPPTPRNIDTETYDLTVKQGKVYSSDTKYVTDVTPNAAQITWSDGDIYSNPSAVCSLPPATPTPPATPLPTAPSGTPTTVEQNLLQPPPPLPPPRHHSPPLPPPLHLPSP